MLKSRFATIKNMARALANAEEVYYLANNEYTSDLTKLDLDLTNLPSNVGMAIAVTNDAVVSLSLARLSMEYVVYFNHHAAKSYRGRRECRVYDGNSVAKKICANLTGTTEVTNDSYSLWAF